MRAQSPRRSWEKRTRSSRMRTRLDIAKVAKAACSARSSCMRGTPDVEGIAFEHPDMHQNMRSAESVGVPLNPPLPERVNEIGKADK